MKHLFLINPAAGKYDHTAELKPQIEAAMAARGWDYAIEITRQPRHAQALVNREAERGEPLRVYACGGDGTLNEAAAGAAGKPHVAVTQFPIGSGNDFIKLFGAGREQFFTLENLFDADEKPMDAIRCNGRWCLNICSIGLDARVGTSIARYKRLPLVTGTGAYYMSAVTEVVRGVHQPFTVTLDGEPFCDRELTLVCICNGRWYGGSFDPVPTALPDDGLLDVLLVEPVSRLRVAAVIGKYAAGRYAEYPQLITHRQCTSLDIHLDRETTVNLDGEVLRTDHAQIELVPQCLRIFYPKGLSWEPEEV